MARVGELNVGDQWFTPAGRWETVTDVDPGLTGLTVRVATDRLPASYTWSLWASREVSAVPAGEVMQRSVVVNQTRGHIWADLTADASGLGRDRGSVGLVGAHHLGPGQGWQVVDTPGGGEQVVSSVDSKAAARTAVTRAAQAHATSLGVPFVPLRGGS